MTSGGVPTLFMGSGVKQDLHLLCSKFSSIESNKLLFRRKLLPKLLKTQQFGSWNSRQERRIRDFADIFREAQFEKILHYRLSPAEHVEFSEYMLQNAVLYCGETNEIGEIRPFKERVFGIYVCYALYNLQPVDHVCQIPITQMQLEELVKFRKLLGTENLVEPLLALQRLFLKKAFHLKVFQSTYDPVTHKKYLSEEEMPSYSRKPIEPFGRAQQLRTNTILGELSLVHKQYMKHKEDLGLTDIQVVTKNPVDEINDCLEKAQQDFETNTEEPIIEECDNKFAESAGTSRSALRSKAYSAGLKHTRQRRHLDPNMEENFKHLTFGQIAQECLHEQKPCLKQLKHKRKRKFVDERPVELDDDAIAELVLQEEYAARVKPELPDDESVFGGKIGKQGTSGVAKIRAPKRKNGKLIQIKQEVDANESTTPSGIDALFNSPEKRKPVIKVEAKPRIDDVWARKLQAWHGQVEATDKQLKKLTSQMKLEMVDEEE